MYVLSVVPTSGRDVLKYFILVHGALSVTLTGPVRMQPLLAECRATLDLVRSLSMSRSNFEKSLAFSCKIFVAIISYKREIIWHIK